MSEQTCLQMKMEHVNQAGDNSTDDNLIHQGLFNMKNGDTSKQNNSIVKLRSNGTTCENEDIILKNYGHDRNILNDLQAEHGVVPDNHVCANHTISEKHQTELGIETKDHLHENDAVSVDPQVEHGVVTHNHICETHISSDEHQTELGIETKDHLHENDTISVDPQTEHSEVIEDHLHDYDTISNNISLGAYHVTDEGDIAFKKLFCFLGNSKRKDKKTTLHKFTEHKEEKQHIDPTPQTELKPLDTIYDSDVKPRHPYIQIIRKGDCRSLDIAGGCTIKESDTAPTRIHEPKHLTVNAVYEKQASLTRSVKESSKRHHYTSTSVVTHATLSHDFDKYDFSFPHRGYAVLIVNKRFTSFSKRDGAQFDVTKSKDILQKLGYYQMNNKCTNLDKESTIKILEAARDEDHSVFDSFALIVSSHGDEKENPRKNGKKEHAIYCTDDQYIFTSDILEMFCDDKCPSLKGKPKLFFIQACRGSKTDIGAEIAVIEANDDITSKVKQGTQPSVGHNNSSTSYYDGKNFEGDTVGLDSHFASVQNVDDTDARGSVNMWEDKPIVHCINDSLIMYAIPSGHFAWRSNVDGSWMLHYLWIDVMNYDYRKPCSFLKVLTATNRKMSNRETHAPGNPGKCGKKAIPVIIHQLVKDIVFRQKRYSEYSKITFV